MWDFVEVGCWCVPPERTAICSCQGTGARPVWDHFKSIAWSFWNHPDNVQDQWPGGRCGWAEITSGPPSRQGCGPLGSQLYGRVDLLEDGSWWWVLDFIFCFYLPERSRKLQFKFAKFNRSLWRKSSFSAQFTFLNTCQLLSSLIISWQFVWFVSSSMLLRWLKFLKRKNSILSCFYDAG